MGDSATLAVGAAIIVASICVLAYFVPGLVLRAIRDFYKNRNEGKGGGNVKVEETPE